ncbi:MAG: hypothetical protein WKF97_17215 [Chitinophagaceae bacterium]
MNNNNNTPHKSSPEGKRSPVSTDLPDSEHDEERMRSEEVTLDLPDVKDIPGQEHIVVPPLGALADTTISSDDEEGAGLFDDEDDEDIIMGSDADVTPAELTMLQRLDEDMPTSDDTRLREAALDDEDLEGEPLNEGSLATDVSGADLDVSGTDADDAGEAIGEEDEENNTYSLGDDRNDDVTEGTP